MTSPTSSSNTRLSERIGPNRNSARSMSAFRSRRWFAPRRLDSGEIVPALTCLALVGTIVLQLALPAGDAPVDAADLAPRRARPIVAAPIPDYAAILAAPVFSSDRINHDNTPGGGPASSGPLTLVGVTIGGRSPSAVLRT